MSKGKQYLPPCRLSPNLLTYFRVLVREHKTTTVALRAPRRKTDGLSLIVLFEAWHSATKRAGPMDCAVGMMHHPCLQRKRQWVVFRGSDQPTG